MHLTRGFLIPAHWTGLVSAQVCVPDPTVRLRRRPAGLTVAAYRISQNPLVRNPQGAFRRPPDLGPRDLQSMGRSERPAGASGSVHPDSMKYMGDGSREAFQVCMCWPIPRRGNTQKTPPRTSTGTAMGLRYTYCRRPVGGRRSPDRGQGGAFVQSALAGSAHRVPSGTKVFSRRGTVRPAPRPAMPAASRRDATPRASRARLTQPPAGADEGDRRSHPRAIGPRVHRDTSMSSSRAWNPGCTRPGNASRTRSRYCRSGRPLVPGSAAIRSYCRKISRLIRWNRKSFRPENDPSSRRPG